MELGSCETVNNQELLCLEFTIEGQRGNVSDKTFRDIINPPRGSNCSFYDYKVYDHQLKAFEALLQDKNVVLASESGSGKTEAWVSYILYKFFNKEKDRALVFYPTNALVINQLSRLSLYGGECLNGYFRVSGELGYDM